MSDEEEEEEGGRKRRAPLSRSRRLSSRRRRKAEDEEEGEEGEGDAEEGGGGGDAAEEAPLPAAVSSGDDDEPEHTRPVSLPSAPSSGTPDFPLVGAPPAERWAGFSGGIRRFGQSFSHFLFGLGRTASEQGQTFGREVVRPFSSALLEAAISLLLLFVMAACGVYTGRYLKLASVGKTSLASLEHKVVQPGEKIDESFFSEGFDTAELHSRANRVLENYLKALQDQDYRAAYDMLSAEWRAELAFQDFEAGYRTTRITSYEIGKAETVDQRHVRIKAELEVEEGGQHKILEALYLAVLSPQGWRLDGSTYR
jgi:hypothetical protein